MKKTCKDCRAFNLNGNCDLGFPNKREYIQHIWFTSKPLQECPKPKTISQYIHYKQSLNK